MTITLMNVTLSPLVAIAVFAATVVTDAVYVFFTAAVTSRQRFRAANWSSIWYLLSAFSVISYTAIRPTLRSPLSAHGSAPICR
ncbi:MAG TPA: hypothetical protein VIE14_01845 [Steroidobacteraceae bacterium]